MKTIKHKWKQTGGICLDGKQIGIIETCILCGTKREIYEHENNKRIRQLVERE